MNTLGAIRPSSTQDQHIHFRGASYDRPGILVRKFVPPELDKVYLTTDPSHDSSWAGIHVFSMHSAPAVSSLADFLYGHISSDNPETDRFTRHQPLCSLPSMYRVESLVEREGNQFNLWYRYFLSLKSKAKKGLENRRAYESRIRVLREFAEPDGKIVNEMSIRDFWEFIQSNQFARRAGLALMDNGNIRAIWKGDDRTHLGLNFLGNKSVRFVIFKRRFSNPAVSRVAGVDSFDGIKKQIIAYDLTSLVNG